MSNAVFQIGKNKPMLPH